MLTTNHFAELAEIVPIGIMQTYVVLMILCVVGGTLYDVVHKSSAKYFFINFRKAEQNGTRAIDNSERMSLAVKTVAVDVLTSAEFCNPNRRIAHLLGMYGFVIYIFTTVIMVFGGAGTSAFWPFFWAVGALMVCVGGYWFWFFIRADVSAEGQSPFRLIKADLFILSLLGSATFGLLWAFFQSVGAGFLSGLFLGLYLIASTVLFGSVPWSKFSHMFFKPAAAYQKKVAVADGSMDNLPKPVDRTNPADSNRHSMELLKDAPLDMGLGIKREQPTHY